MCFDGHVLTRGVLCRAAYARRPSACLMGLYCLLHQAWRGQQQKRAGSRAVSVVWSACSTVRLWKAFAAVESRTHAGCRHICFFVVWNFAAHTLVLVQHSMRIIVSFGGTPPRFVAAAGVLLSCIVLCYALYGPETGLRYPAYATWYCVCTGGQLFSPWSFTRVCVLCGCAACWVRLDTPQLMACNEQCRAGLKSVDSACRATIELQEVVALPTIYKCQPKRESDARQWWCWKHLEAATLSLRGRGRPKKSPTHISPSQHMPCVSTCNSTVSQTINTRAYSI